MTFEGCKCFQLVIFFVTVKPKVRNRRPLQLEDLDNSQWLNLFKASWTPFKTIVEKDATHAAGSKLFLDFESKATFAATFEITVADSSDRLFQRLASLLYLNGLPLIVFISGSPFLGADSFTLPLLRLEPEGLDTEVTWKCIHLPYGLSSTIPASRVHNKTRVLKHWR